MSRDNSKPKPFLLIDQHGNIISNHRSVEDAETWIRDNGNENDIFQIAKNIVTITYKGIIEEIVLPTQGKKIK